MRIDLSRVPSSEPLFCPRADSSLTRVGHLLTVAGDSCAGHSFQVLGGGLIHGLGVGAVIFLGSVSLLAFCFLSGLTPSCISTIYFNQLRVA